MPKQKGRSNSPDSGPMSHSHYDYYDMDEFEFYERFAKQLVLKLPEKKSRALGAQWLRRLKEQHESQKAIIAIKLLLLSLSRGFLSSPFDKPPPSDLCMFDRDDLTIVEMARHFLSTGRFVGDGTPAYPPITTTMATDFRQYASVQEIPKFGIHCYYATSPDPITSWTLPPGRNVLGSADQASPLAWEKCMAKISACVPEIGSKGCSKSR